MLWIPHCLRQAVAWAFLMCQVDTPEVALSRSLQQRLKLHHLLMCYVIPVHHWRTTHRFPDRVLSLEITRVFVFQAQEFFPPDPAQNLSLVLRHSSQFSSAVGVSDATCEPGVHTWVMRKLCELTPSDWMLPPLPYVMDSGFHTDWPLPIPLQILHSLANCKLHSREIPNPPQDRSFILWYAFGPTATLQAMTPRSTPSIMGVQIPASPVLASCTYSRRTPTPSLCSPWCSYSIQPISASHFSPSP